MIDETMKKWVDEADYTQLLQKWRNEPVGSPWFQGEIGTYFKVMLHKKQSEVGNEAHVRASKEIGWDG